jgi:F-type H+-transporting ATPase subunit delta
MTAEHAAGAPEGRHVALVPTVFDEKSSELARTYAEALLNATAKSGQTQAVLDELDAVRDFVLTKFPTFAVMMGSPVRTAADKDRIIVEAFEGRALPTSVHFLRVLNRRGRLEMLGRVLQSAHEVWDRRQNRRPVTVRSAVPLTDAQQAALRDRLASSLGATPVLTLEVDPGLIGGLVVQVGDDVYDASVRNRLEQLRHRLTEGKTHEIQSRRDHFSHSE